MINILMCPYGNSMPTTQTGDILAFVVTLITILMLISVGYSFYKYDILKDKLQTCLFIGFVVFWIFTMILNLVFYWW